MDDEINPETNWGIREFDYTKIGKEDPYDTRGTFPTPDELKQRLRAWGFGDKLPFFLKPHTMKQGPDLNYVIIKTCSS